jgi:HD-GYP domain-containing protein (c-di-GMP phosphodiesterase class II)
MTSDRPYRKAMLQDTAFSILETQRGIQFDPEIIDAFSAALRTEKEGKK